MSPPSMATAGRTRVSSNSLITSTVSASSASKNSSPVASCAAAPSARIGLPLMKCSMTAPRIAGLIWAQSTASCLVTETKSAPRKTPATPSSENSAEASGDSRAVSVSRKSRGSPESTSRPGRNFSVAGLGVASVWMNMCAASYVSERPDLCDEGARKISLEPFQVGSEDNPFTGKCKSFALQALCVSAQGRQIRVGNRARHNGDRHAEGVGPARRERGDQRAWPFRGIGSGEHQNGDVGVFGDLGFDLLGLLAFANHLFDLDRAEGGYGSRMAGLQRLDGLIGLGAHHLLDPQPVVVIVGLDDREQHHGAPGAAHPERGKGHRLGTFGAFIDDDEEFTLIFIVVSILAVRQAQVRHIVAGGGHAATGDKGGASKSRPMQVFPRNAG